MELKPGTPEYDEAYKKEMERLEAEAAKKPEAPAKKADEITSAAPDKKGADDGKKTESADEINARLAKYETDLKAAQKAIKDTQRWGHENAKEVKRLKQEAEARTRRETLADDPLLKANPGLEDTIKRVAGPVEADKPQQETWLQTVARAIPDVETLLGDQAFYSKAAEKKAELGGEWDDPISAIRELSALRTEHLTKQGVTAAVDAARKDFESKSKKRNAMEVPGGSGGKDAGAQGDDAVKRFQTMSKADFDKERSRVMGY